MTFQLDWILYLNIAIIVLLLWSIVRLISKGLLLGLIQLLRVIIALVAAMILASPLAQVFPLLNYKSGGTEMAIANLLSTRGSQPVWFVIVFVVGLLLTKLIEPLIRLIDGVPIVTSLNRLGGFILGVIVGWIKVIMVMFLFTTPLFTNGEEVIQNSYLVYAKQSVEILDATAEPFKNNVILQKYTAGQALTHEEQAVVEEWMSEKGIGHDQIVDFLESIKNE